MINEELKKRVDAEFEREFEEFIRENPHFADKGNSFLENLRTICELFFTKGQMSSVFREFIDDGGN